jgi:hypothetical protein
MENKEEELMVSNKINNIEFGKNSTFEELLLIQNLIKKESALKELCKKYIIIKFMIKYYIYSFKIKR